MMKREARVVYYEDSPLGAGYDLQIKMQEKYWETCTFYPTRVDPDTGQVFVNAALIERIKTMCDCDWKFTFPMRRN